MSSLGELFCYNAENQLDVLKVRGSPLSSFYDFVSIILTVR